MIKSKYIDEVMRKLNEGGWDDAFDEPFAGADTTNIEVQISNSYMSAWRKSTLILPKSYYYQATMKDANSHFFDEQKGTGCLLIPSDYYMLGMFKMKGWEKPVFNAVEETDEIAQIQANEYIRGNYILPVCTILNYAPLYERMSEDGQRRMLRYYSLPKGRSHVIEFAYYIPIARDISTEDDNYEMSLKSELYEPLEWIHAGIVFTIFEKYDQAKICDARAAETK